MVEDRDGRETGLIARTAAAMASNVCSSSTAVERRTTQSHGDQHRERLRMPRSGMTSGIGFNLTLCPLFSPAAKTTLDGVDSNSWGRGKELGVEAATGARDDDDETDV